MRVAVLQPSYLPWLGYFDQMASVDAFVFYDDVQFDRGGWRNRNRIRTSGEPGWSWLTIPVMLHGFPKISEVAIDERMPWRRKHLASLRNAYARAPHFAVLERFEPFYAAKSASFVDTVIDNVRTLAALLEVSTPLYRSSELGIDGDRNERLVAICRHFRADEYLSGDAARAYLDEGLFARAGIRVLWQSYDHPVYPQLHGEFISHLSAIDAVLNLGPAASGLVGRGPKVSS
jgi:hypothetical protein